MRKTSSFKNFMTSFFPFIVLMVLGFWKVSVWQKGLGEDVFALNQLFFQLFGYLSLAEAGIGALVQKEYYKLLVDEKRDAICAFYTISKKLLRKVSIFIIFSGFILSFFLKMLTKDNNLSANYMQLVFMIFLVKSIVDYFMFSPRYVLQADQKIYKINICMNLYKIIEGIVEIIFILMGYDYLVVLIVTLCIRIITNLRVNRIIFKEYPWLKETKDTSGYHIRGMRYVLNHKIVGAVQDNTALLVISTFISPAAVFIYTSYNYILKYLNDFIYLFAASITSSLGNLIYSEEKEKSLLTFEMINIMFLFIASFLSLALLFVTNPFVSLWIGSDKIIDEISFVCLILMFFHNLARRPILILRDVFALYKETQVNVICEAVVNLVLSLILVQNYGIPGIVIANIIGTLVTNFWYFPYIVYKEIYHKDCYSYLIKYAIGLIITVTLFIVSLNFQDFMACTSYLIWFLKSILYSIVIFILLSIIFYVLFDSFRRLVKTSFDFLMSIIRRK
ncbi:MAG: hypothetical protein RR945_03860 [Erysipelotrichaceae bacterium]